MSRPTTILALLDAFVLRADLRWRRGRAVAERMIRIERGRRDAADVIETLVASRRLSGSVFVLSDEVFLQSIDLPPRAVAGLDRRAMRSAVALEAQSFSGLTGDTATEWWRRGDERTFLVCQASRGEFTALHEAIERGGGELFGVAHPAALPASLAGDGPFVRREDWGALRARIRGHGAEVETIEAGRGTRMADQDEGCSEHLVVGASAPELAGARRFDLVDDAVATNWLARWAQVAIDADRGVVLEPPPSPSVRHRRVLLGAIAVGAVVAAGLLDRFGVQADVFAATRELAVARVPIDRLRAVEVEGDRLEQQLAALRAPQAAAAPTVSRWTPTALTTMLEALAAERPDGVVLDECTLGFRRCAVRGRTPEAGAVDRWTSALVKPLGRIGYSVLPGNRQVLPPDEAALFDFSIEFVPVVLSASPRPEAAK